MGNEAGCLAGGYGWNGVKGGHTCNIVAEGGSGQVRLGAERGDADAHAHRRGHRDPGVGGQA